MQLRATETPRIIGQRLAQPASVFAIIAVALVATTSILTMYGASQWAYTLPIALAAVVGLLINPYAAYVAVIAAPNILPTGGRFLFVKVPNTFQFLVPAVAVGSLIRGWRDKEWRGFRFHFADVFVLWYIIWGYAGIFLIPGPREWKYFSNVITIPASLYFTARWQPLDRRRFRRLLDVYLLAALFVLVVMAQSRITHRDPFFSWRQRVEYSLGPQAESPAQSIVTCFLGGLFIYAFATRLGAGGRLPRRYLWALGATLTPIVQVIVAQRAGTIASAVAAAACLIHPRLFKPTAQLFVLALIAGSIWYLHYGGEARGRFAEQDPLLMKRMYREKAVRYIESPAWNPFLGTGYGRLPALSGETLPLEDVYDANLGAWRRPGEVAGDNPIHCAPITILGEHGWVGVATLACLAICILASLLRVFALAQQANRPADTELLIALLAAAVATAITATYHNSDKVMYLLMWVWSIVGTIVGQPHVFVLSVEEVAQRAAGDLGRRRWPLRGRGGQR